MTTLENTANILAELQNTAFALYGNVDALETEILLIKQEKEELINRIKELESVIKQKVQHC